MYTFAVVAEISNLQERLLASTTEPKNDLGTGKSANRGDGDEFNIWTKELIYDS